MSAQSGGLRTEGRTQTLESDFGSLAAWAAAFEGSQPAPARLGGEKRGSLSSASDAPTLELEPADSSGAGGKGSAAPAGVGFLPPGRGPWSEDASQPGATAAPPEGPVASQEAATPAPQELQDSLGEPGEVLHFRPSWTPQEDCGTLQYDADDAAWSRWGVLTAAAGTAAGAAAGPGAVAASGLPAPAASSARQESEAELLAAPAGVARPGLAASVSYVGDRRLSWHMEADDGGANEDTNEAADAAAAEPWAEEEALGGASGEEPAAAAGAEPQKMVGPRQSDTFTPTLVYGDAAQVAPTLLDEDPGHQGGLGPDVGSPDEQNVFSAFGSRTHGSGVSQDMPVDDEAAGGPAAAEVGGSAANGALPHEVVKHGLLRPPRCATLASFSPRVSSASVSFSREASSDVDGSATTTLAPHVAEGMPAMVHGAVPVSPAPHLRNGGRSRDGIAEWQPSRATDVAAAAEPGLLLEVEPPAAVIAASLVAVRRGPRVRLVGKQPLHRTATSVIRQEIGHMLRPPEMGSQVLVRGDGWGGGCGEYEATITEADALTFTVIRKRGRLWEETHVLRDHCSLQPDAEGAGIAGAPMAARRQRT